MKLEFQEYRPRKIINIHKHVDGPWFWGKYTAHPYVGCRSGCEFCYSRGSRYLGRRDPDTFDTLIRVKVNAIELLRKELPPLAHEVITVGDWQQPAENKYMLSRKMLEVVCEYHFPLFIVERSPLVVRDLDLLTQVNDQNWCSVLFSISNLDPDLKRAFEPRSPGVKRRLIAMEKLASAGILVGTAMMPILPYVGDNEKQLEELVRATKDHGGSCILAGGLTMDGIQAERTLAAARHYDLAMEDRWRKFYKWKVDGKPSFGPPRAYNARLGLLVRELCERHGLLDHLPRYITPGPLAINKRIAEKLFLRTYDLELELATDQRIWAYRRAAWTVDELPESIAKLYTAREEAGLREVPGIGVRLAGLIARWLDENAMMEANEGSPPQ